MKSIDIDIEVYKMIEGARQDFDESHNTILRRLLGIDDFEDILENNNNVSEEIANYQNNILDFRLRGYRRGAPGSWYYGGVSLPEGTKLQKWLGKQRIEAIIHQGSIYVNGEYHQSPSSAAMAVNGGRNVNGWNFWEYFDEETKNWQKLGFLRK